MASPPQASSIQQRQSLPIFQARKNLVRAFHEHKTTVVIGETASGKTTQIPQYLLESGLARRGAIACTQPRRVAATSVAQRVADEMGTRLGREVGYSVRFDDCSCTSTKIRYMTDGMLLREAIADPLLKRYSVVVLDEAHERTLHTDVLFGVVKQAQQRRLMSTHACLKIIVMSATLDADQFAEYFDKAPVLYVEGRQFPVRVLYAAEPQQNYMRSALVTTLQLHRDPEVEGDFLLFLTGQEEIEAMCRMLAECLAHVEKEKEEFFDFPSMLVRPLYGAMPPQQQQDVFEAAPEGTRKVIVSTNIAETSVTIPGVRHVIDAGLVKLKVYDPRTFSDVLRVHPTSKAQARQRCGRAGREASGRCYRIYTEDSFDNELSENTTPELLRSNLSSVYLQLLALGIEDVVDFDFLDVPSIESTRHALETLLLLSAVAKADELQLTDLGKKMAHFPLDPKLAKVLLKAQDYQCGIEILTIVAMLTVESVLYIPHGERESATNRWKKFQSDDGDHMMLLAIYRSFKKSKGHSGWCKENFINSKKMKKVKLARQQLREVCERLDITLESCGQDTTKIRQCLSHGLFMESAELQPNGQYMAITSRETVHIHPSSALFNVKPRPAYLIFSELVHTSRRYMRNVSVVDKDWLTEASPF